MNLALPSVLAATIGIVSVLLWSQPVIAPELQEIHVENVVRSSVIETSLEVKSKPDFLSISDATLIEVISRPLFSESRLPEQYVEIAPEIEFEPIQEPDFIVEETVWEVESSPVPPPKLAMTGFMSDEENPTALISDEIRESEEWVSIGETIEGWEVVSITSQEVTFMRNDSKFIVKLYE